MTKLHLKTTTHIITALALSAGLFSATNANAGTQKCMSLNMSSPHCTTPAEPISKGKNVYFGGATLILGDKTGGSATLTVNNGIGIIFSTRITRPYNSYFQVTSPNRRFSVGIVTDWNNVVDPAYPSKVAAVVSTAPTNQGLLEYFR
jgi:hypothetical protein